MVVGAHRWLDEVIRRDSTSCNIVFDAFHSDVLPVKGGDVTERLREVPGLMMMNRKAPLRTPLADN